jgi:hypothetical protein
MPYAHFSPVLCSGTLIDPLVDRGDLFNPAPSIGVLQVQNILWRPVEVVGDEGYLLV